MSVLRGMETGMTARTASGRSRPAVVFAVSATTLAFIAFAWHLSALALHGSTVGSRPLDDRIAAAQAASRIEPWNAHFEWRVVTLKAERLLDADEIDDAFWLLQPLSQEVRGDALYRAVYQRAVRLKAPLDSRKAHVQHGKEKEGGVLDPEDVQR